MNASQTKRIRKERRHKRIRARITGTQARPRLAVYKSNTALAAQLINDEAGVTLLSIRTKPHASKKPVEVAFEVGKKFAETAHEKGVTKVVFDRGGIIYAGRVKSFADGAREGGLSF